MTGATCCTKTGLAVARIDGAEFLHVFKVKFVWVAIDLIEVYLTNEVTFTELLTWSHVSTNSLSHTLQMFDRNIIAVRLTLNLICTAS